MIVFIRLIQCILVLVPLLAFGWLWVQWSVPSGIFFVSHEVGDASPFIDDLKPSQRVSDILRTNQGDVYQSIHSAPAFFFVHPHRDFERVDVEVWFQNKDLPLIELGGLSSIEPEVYTLKPLHNLLIDQSDWHRLEQEGQTLLQREQVYDSIKDFYADPPSRDEVAVYRAELATPYRIENYQPSLRMQTIDASLRGHHEAKTYIKDEALVFEFEYMDMNRDEGEDVLSVLVFNEQNQPVAEARASDDGNTSDDARPTGLEHLELRVDGLREGVYKLVINATRDIFIRKIHTPQSKLVFLNSLFIGDEVGYREPPAGTRLWTNAARLRLQTLHAEGVQTITVEDEPFEIAEPYTWYPVKNPGALAEVDIPVGDVEIILDGKVAFLESQFFNPDPVDLRYHTSLADIDTNYIIANYLSPRQEGEWLVSLVSFGKEELYSAEDGTWKFSFSTPFIEELNAEVFVHMLRSWFYKDNAL